MKFSRKKTVETTLWALLATSPVVYPRAAGTSRTSTNAGTQYNVLFLMTDSLDGRVLDPTSRHSTYVDMPYMWNLASQGANFINMYTNSPQCAPSRTSMFTGRYPHQVGAWSNSKALAATPGSGTTTGVWELDPGCVNLYDEVICSAWAQEQNVSATFVDTLVQGGVHVGLYGKLHVGGNLVLREDQTMHGPGHAFPDRRGLSVLGRAADVRKPVLRSRPDSHAGLCGDSHSLDDCLEHIHAEDWHTMSGCMDWLENNRNRDSQWVLYCSLVLPHPPNVCSSEALSHVDPNIPLPAWFTSPDSFPEGKMHPYDSYTSIRKSMNGDDFTASYIDTYMRCWYAMCYETDYLLGQIWEKAGETGNLENTLVMLTSDHGEMRMEHRQHKKNSLYEASARVPLIITPPGSKPGPGARKAFQHQGAIIRDLASLIDIYPTLVDATGIPAPNFLEGQSLLPYLSHEGHQTNRPVISTYTSDFANTNAFMLRHGPWKYIAYGKYGPDCYGEYAPRLFNLSQDPDELFDISAQATEVVTKLDTVLRSLIDVDAVDRKVKMEERMLYDRYYKEKPSSELRKDWEDAYIGFDDSDEAKVALWYKAVESAPQPEAAKALKSGLRFVSNSCSLHIGCTASSRKFASQS